MSELLVLDPSEVADADRTEIDITKFVAQDGPDWGESSVEAAMADLRIGSLVVDYRRPLREIKIPLLLHSWDGYDFEDIRSAVQAKVALWQDEGGWIKRSTAVGDLYADVVNASLILGADSLAAWGLVDAAAVLTLQAIPDFYGDEEQLTITPSSGTGGIEGVIDVVPGNTPARTRIVVTETSGQDQLGLIAALRGRHYSDDATAALVYEAEALDPLDTAAVATRTGASGGASNNVVAHTNLPSSWTPVLGTNIGGTTFLTHTGTYRVRVRAYSANGSDVSVRLAWDVGDLIAPIVNADDAKALPGASAFYLLDLGEVRLDEMPVGAHRWQGEIQARGTIGGEDVEIDEVRFEPVDDDHAVLSAPVVEQETAAASFGPRSGGTFASDSAGGTQSWSNPSNATGSDDSYATATFTAVNQITHYLKATNFGFNIPSGATIDGIQVDIERKASPPGGIKDNSVKIVKGGTVSGSEHSAAAAWPIADAYESFGGPTDLWGTTWAVTDINASNFGVVFSAKETFFASSTASVDHIRVTVYYTPASVPDDDAILFADQSAELRSDGTFRESSDGSAYGPTRPPIGDLLRLPPSGPEGRPVELYLRGSRGDLDELADAALDGLSVKVHVRPCWLTVPGG